MTRTTADSPTVFPDDNCVPLEAVLCTEELKRRPSRPPDYETENRALAALAQALADSPRRMLQKLADTILEVFQCDSAGLSLVTHDGKRFSWPAIAGAWKSYVGGGTPRHFGPCGDVLDRNAPLLFKHFERRYSYLLPVTPPAEEALLIPFHVHGHAVGTIWAMAHDDRRRFDAEDLRQLESLGRFAAAAYQAVDVQQDQDSRRAALNLLEDAVQSRQAIETLNRQLRDSEANFRMLADNISQLAWTCDQLGNVTWYNQRWLDYTGLTFEEMRGWGWKAVQHPDHVDRVVARVQRSADTGEPWEDTFPLRGKDGQYRWFLSRAVPIRDPEGKVVCWFGTNTDITEQRKMAEELQQNTADLAEADRHKTEFLAMLAHELRNPLAPIRNALQILAHTASRRRETSEDTLVQAASAMMGRQVGQLVRLVDDLLDVNRISRGKVELRRGRVELASVVNQAVEAVRPQCESMDHELLVTLPPQPLYLNADSARLAQVVGNLLHNACKFTDKGGHIGLTVEREGAQAVLRVRDSGVGIAAEELPRIFNMFEQVNTSLERTQGGLGIGLTLVKNLVEMHGGTVQAHSAGVGQGSEFVVRLPILEETNQPPPPEPAVSEPPPLTGRRILVVDDNRDSAESLALLLKLTGNQTHTAYDGLEAVEAAADFKPDVVLLDIGLPKLNGYEAARRIREQPGAKRMVLVALTGWGQDEDRRKAREAGFNGHLVKPVDYAALMKLLAETLATPG